MVVFIKNRRLLREKDEEWYNDKKRADPSSIIEPKLENIANKDWKNFRNQ